MSTPCGFDSGATTVVKPKRINGTKDDNNKIDPNNLDVTYLYYGDEHTEKVEVFGSTHASVGGTQLQRFLRTSLFFGTETVPKDARLLFRPTKSGFSYVNLMDQYSPAGRVGSSYYPEINGRIAAKEYEAALETADTVGLRRLDNRAPQRHPAAYH